MSLPLLILSLFFGTTLASIAIYDPSDTLPETLYTEENSIAPDYHIPFIPGQPSDIIAAYTYSGSENSTTISHASFNTTLNDTSVLLIANGADVTLSYVDVLKEGYSSNLFTASFWGFNAAINVANASTADFDNLNITVHDGAANVYAYGTDTKVTISDSWLYSSGPVSHGLYAAGNGSIYATNIHHFSGGIRSSSFSGDNPAGYLYINDSVAHTTGIGSATFYALGEIYAHNVYGYNEKAPSIFMDGHQKVVLTNCECTAGLLGGVAIFSSMRKISGATVSFTDSKLTTLGDVPGLWFGNIIADVTIINTQIVPGNGILVVANFSQITQDFNHYADYSEQNNLDSAEVFVHVEESTLEGDLVAFNGSSIIWSLGSYSTWTGSAYSGFGAAYFDVSIDNTSTWLLTANTTVQNLSAPSIDRIVGGGFDLFYDKSASLNGWLGGKTLTLSGGGSAIPY